VCCKNRGNLKELIGGVKKSKGPLEKSGIYKIVGKFTMAKRKEEETIEKKNMTEQSEIRHQISQLLLRTAWK
jgi:hypothetical protein